MRASLERHCEHRGTIRVHPTDDGKFGDPYFWVSGCSFNYEDDPEAIYIGGFCTKITPAIWMAIRELLREEKFVYVVWEKRRLDGHMDIVKGHIETNKRVF